MSLRGHYNIKGRGKIMSSTQLMEGEFIWKEGEVSPINSYVRFRKVFELQGKVQSSQLKIFADSRYKLFVNGKYVGFGPARFDPEYPEYDTYEVKDFLREGKNCVAILVHHYGVDTFFYIRRRGGLTLDCNIKTEDEEVKIVSDKSWKVSSHPCWDSRSPKIDLQLGFVEIYDAWEDDDWQDANCDETSWENPVSFESVWGELNQRSIPHLGGAIISEAKSVKKGFVQNTPKLYNVQLGFFFDTNLPRGAFAYTNIYSPKEATATLGFDENDKKDIWLNGEKLKLNKDKNAISRQIVSVNCQKGWNLLFIHMNGSWDIRYEFNMSLLSGDGILLSATCSKEETGTFFVTDILTGDSLIEKVVSHYDEPSKAPVHWHNFLCPCNNLALKMSWEHLEEEVSSVTPIPVDLRENQFIIFDFGKEVFGCPIISLEASEGSIVDIGYAEHLTDGRINPAKSMVWYADRYITKSGEQSWELFSSRAFRYIEVVIRKADQPVRLDGLRVREISYPVKDIGSFQCSDELLNKIWSMGKETLRLCMEDAYTDCPWRERGQWWGDARVEYLTNRVTFGDNKLFARGLRQIASSQLENGHINAVYPTPFDCVISEYSLIWVISIWDYYHYSGERELVKKLFPNVKKLLGYFENQIDETGLTVSSSPAPLIDWVDIDKKGAVAALNAFFYRALIDGAKMAELCGEENMVNRYLSLVSQIKSSFSKLLYDEAKGCYVDSIAEGKKSEKSNIHSNCLPLLFGMVPDKIKEGIVRFIKGRLSNIFDKPDASGWSGQVISPYFMFYALGSLYAAGEDSAALNEIRRRWGWMLERGATTCWENFTIENSLCHAWSSAPTYYLSTEVLGIKFPEPGNLDKVSIEPHPGDLRWARGSIPHPAGRVIVEWNIDEKDYMRLNIRLPKASEIRATLPGYCKMGEVHIELAGEKIFSGRIEPCKEVILLRQP